MKIHAASLTMLIAILAASTSPLARCELPPEARSKMNRWIVNGVHSKDDLRQINAFLQRYAVESSELTDSDVYRLGAVVQAYIRNEPAGPSAETTSNVSTKEWRSEALNCSVQVPDTADWEPIANEDPDVRLQLHTKDGKKSINLIVTSLERKDQTLDASFIKSFERGSQDNGNRASAPGKNLTIQGVPAYQSNTTYVDGKMTPHTLQVILITGGKFYQIAATDRDVQPEDDVELRSYVGSFRLLTSAPKTALHPSRERNAGTRDKPISPGKAQGNRQTLELIRQTILQYLSKDEDDW